MYYQFYDINSDYFDFDLLIITVPTKSLETTCHFPFTFYYNIMFYQI